ncbi:DUF3509 domain-containing protein [Pseudomonas solani]|uniref:DUF3509 domain-containing protein n=1 Tax=Pseudomonas solani TaxID=2731552 RepID=UPI003C2E19AF
MKPITTYLANSFPEHSVTMSARPGGSLVVCLERAGNRYLRVVAAGALADADQLDALVKQIELDLKLRKGGELWLATDGHRAGIELPTYSGMPLRLGKKPLMARPQ